MRLNAKNVFEGFSFIGLTRTRHNPPVSVVEILKIVRKKNQNSEFVREKHVARW